MRAKRRLAAPAASGSRHTAEEPIPRFQVKIYDAENKLSEALEIALA